MRRGFFRFFEDNMFGWEHLVLFYFFRVLPEGRLGFDQTSPQQFRCRRRYPCHGKHTGFGRELVYPCPCCPRQDGAGRFNLFSMFAAGSVTLAESDNNPPVAMCKACHHVFPCAWPVRTICPEHLFCFFFLFSPSIYLDASLHTHTLHLSVLDTVRVIV